MMYWLLMLIVSATCASTLQVDRVSNASVHVLLSGVELGANSNKHAARMQEYRDALAANLRHPQGTQLHFDTWLVSRCAIVAGSA